VTARFAIYVAPGTVPANAVPANTVPPNAVPPNTAGTAPPETAGPLLREKAERWLGRSVSGDPVPTAAPAGWTRAAVDLITVDARRYGFHGTLKAPFRLANGRTQAELDAALTRFAASHASVVIPRLSLARLGGFFALVPGAQKEEAAGLYGLADEVVTRFDHFRAPATEAEIARRDPAALTPRQRDLLAAWGYPYVLDEFRFHLTLTDRIPAARRPEVEHTLNDWFAEVVGADVPVDALALFTEAEPGAPFQLHALYPLQPVPSPWRAVHAAGSEGAR
jgi:Protein of unknown function (DUF1045)